MAGHNFIRNEVFDENVDRLNEITIFVITERKTTEYNATIAALDSDRERLRNAAQRDEAAIDAIDTRLRNQREKKRQFEIAEKAKLDSNLEKQKALGEKKEESVIASDFTLNIPENSLEDWIAKLRVDNVQLIVNVHYKEIKDCLYKTQHRTIHEQDAGFAAKDIYFAGAGANKDAWEQDKANKAYERGSKNARTTNATARRPPQNWVLLKRVGLNDSRMEDTAIRYMDFQK